MPTPKKTKAQQAQEASEERARVLEQTGQQAAQSLEAAGAQYINDLNAANQARTDAYNAAQQAYQQRMNEGYTQFADIIAREEQRANDAEQEAIAQRQAEQRAAKWTGATELAASLGNLIAVGGDGASNQQYHSYSQDWMRIADQNWRINRARFDNLRDRQRALQQQLIHMKMGDAGQALNMANRQADAAYQHGVSVGQTRYQTGTAPINILTQAAKEAAAAREQGVLTGINVEMKERDQDRQDKATDASINQGWKRIENDEKAREMNMRLYGYVPDKNAPGGYRYDPSQAVRGTSSRSSSSGGSGRGLEIPLMAHGNLPAETIRVKDEKALETIIFSNIDAVTDLTVMQKNALVGLLEDDSIDADKKARELRRYLVSSGQLRSLFRSQWATQDNADADNDNGWLFRMYQPE